jgi:hypothetical protein
MDVTEKLFRDTPQAHTKYTKRLTSYISYLYDNQKYIESAYFFAKLEALKPKHILTIRLGYNLGIALFDNRLVEKYDSLLMEARPSPADLEWFRLRYYISVSDKTNYVKTALILLSKKLKEQHITTILQLCIESKEPLIAIPMVRHFYIHNIKPSPEGNGCIKKILIQKLADVISERLYA